MTIRNDYYTHAPITVEIHAERCDENKLSKKIEDTQETLTHNPQQGNTRTNQ